MCNTLRQRAAACRSSESRMLQAFTLIHPSLLPPSIHKASQAVMPTSALSVNISWLLPWATFQCMQHMPMCDARDEGWRLEELEIGLRRSNLKSLGCQCCPTPCACKSMTMSGLSRHRSASAAHPGHCRTWQLAWALSVLRMCCCLHHMKSRAQQHARCCVTHLIEMRVRTPSAHQTGASPFQQIANK